MLALPISFFRRGLVLSAALLLLVLLPAAGATAGECGDSAHPSGKDRCEESGGSGTQGSATSDPDDDGRGPDRSNGGVDQEGGEGGVNTADQDGNNGCGNDQDFEDDNEGLCGGNPDKGAPAAAGKDKAEDAKDKTKAKAKDAKSKDAEPAKAEFKRDADTARTKRAAEAAEANQSTAKLSDNAAVGSGDQPAAAVAAGGQGRLGRAAAALAATGVNGIVIALAALALLVVGFLALRRSRSA